MPCSRKEALAKFFFNNLIKFFFVFFYLFSLFFAKLFTFFFRYEDEYEDEDSYEDEDENEEEEYRYQHMEDENGGDGLVLHANDLHGVNEHDVNNDISLAHSNSCESLFQDPVEAFDDEELHLEFELDYNNDYVVVDETTDYYEVTQEDSSRIGSNVDEKSKLLVIDDNNNNHRRDNSIKVCPISFDEMPTKSPTFIDEIEEVKEESNFTQDEKFLIFDPPKSEVKKLLQDMEKESEEIIFEDTYTVGSTSKSSSDWRSSMRDSAITDDPFSSSSRRSCPKWESYAVYQKYDEEMMFLDRIKSLRSFQVEPRSISQRIVHKIANNKKKNLEDEIYNNKKKNNPYNELEVAYVAQICLAWEALNWNYATFKRKQASKTEFVLLQRYVETEPYERGKRPEIYARMRNYEGEDNEDAKERIATESFLKLLEDGIQTFMNFLKADRESHCQIIKAALFKARPRGTIDPNIIKVVKKYNKKKKLKLKELRQSNRVCLKRRKLPREEDMEILMGLIDLEVVSRVLRMVDLTPEQLHWCEAKMGKLQFLDGKLLRDSSPLFFPAH
ncbi:Canalicular multispecific organic anion transporter 1 [Bienertia sinuspersici]